MLLYLTVHHRRCPCHIFLQFLTVFMKRTELFNKVSCFPVACIYLRLYLAVSCSLQHQWLSLCQTCVMVCRFLLYSQLSLGSNRNIPGWGHALGIYKPSLGSRCTGPRCQCQLHSFATEQEKYWAGKLSKDFTIFFVWVLITMSYNIYFFIIIWYKSLLLTSKSQQTRTITNVPCQHSVVNNC